MKFTTRNFNILIMHVLDYLFYISYLVPVDSKKIVATSFNGRGFSDNPKSIVESIIYNDLDYKIYWPIKKANILDSVFPKKVTPIRYGSLRHIYHLFSAKVWIDNCRKPIFVHKKPSQLYIQTWHGFPLKQIEKDVENKLTKNYVKSAKNDSKMIDVMVSNSELMTNCYKNSFWYDGDILQCGTPRNDSLVNQDDIQKDKIKTLIGINNVKTVLYAPTFRQNKSHEAYSLDFEKIIKVFKMKFGGEWTVLLRLHPNVEHITKNEVGNNVVNVSSYPDAQELLHVADALITDYSSIMFDYMITNKPCFIYATDISEYIDDRNFYFPLESTPFSISQTNNEIINAILMFDKNKYINNINRFILEHQIIEKGDAADSVVKWIISKNLKGKS